MACYRAGGCGPYEHLSCSECPASKPEYAVKKEPQKVGKNSGLPVMFSTEYVQGYLAALMDVKRLIPYVSDDLRAHKKRMSLKALFGIIDVLIKERAILRENPDAFVRCTQDGGFEVYIAHKDDKGNYV